MTAHEPRCTGTKTCTKCARSLPVLAFAIHRTNLDGLAGHCRDCHGEYVSNRVRRKHAELPSAGNAFKGRTSAIRSTRKHEREESKAHICPL